MLVVSEVVMDEVGVELVVSLVVTVVLVVSVVVNVLVRVVLVVSPVVGEVVGVMNVLTDFSAYLAGKLSDLLMFSDAMNSTHWGLVSICVIAFGFLCLRGPGFNR